MRSPVGRPTPGHSSAARPLMAAINRPYLRQVSEVRPGSRARADGSNGGRIAKGEVWPALVVEDGDVEDLDPDERARDDLQVAVDGKGAFRRFHAALYRHEANRVDWRVWSSERRMGRTREWLANEGYDPIP